MTKIEITLNTIANFPYLIKTLYLNLKSVLNSSNSFNLIYSLTKVSVTVNLIF